MTNHTGQLINLQLRFMPLLKSLEQMAISEHYTTICSLRCTRHKAVETLRRRGRDSAAQHGTRSESGPRRRGAPFGTKSEARGPAQLLGAPRSILLTGGLARRRREGHRRQGPKSPAGGPQGMKKIREPLNSIAIEKFKVFRIGP